VAFPVFAPRREGRENSTALLDIAGSLC